MSIVIQFISDYVCPVCYINKVALQKACEGKDVQIEYLPYELTPEPQKQPDTYHDPIRKSSWQKTLAPVAKKLNLDIKLPPNISPRPYTRLAHEGYYYALDHEKGSLYNSRIYELYFSEESDISDITVLKKLASEIGLNADDFENALKEGTYRSRLKDASNSFPPSLTVTTLPTIKIGETVLSGGTYSQEYFETLLNKTQAAANPEIVNGAGCSVNGCTF